MRSLDAYIKEIEKELSTPKASVREQEIGVLTEIRDGVAIVTGLKDAFYGEILEFQNGINGFIIDLTEDSVGVVILGDYLSLTVGTLVKATGRILSLSVSEKLLGRVIDPLSNAIDGGTKLKPDKFYPIEKIAPGVVYRKSVSVPLQTGIKAIDAMIPVGRGQRELIIGDRSTGKSTIAIDTIINQKNENVICIYCGIGQKNSKIASVIETLKKNKALDYTIVVSAAASDSVALQYLAPYSATAIAEYFLDKGKDVLVIYDDLTKHAWAYRQISLVLRRPAGREAYPGDIFYLHSRLLERACRIDPKYGGGSITALPIIETLEGDISGYIPTNVISITDGQLFLETELFNSDIRPAINVGTSVSRVGGSAQTKAMKQVASGLKLDLAQYRSLAAFSQFESDLDEETKKSLNRGAKVTQILKQKKHEPYSLGEQVVVLWAATHGYLDKLAIHEVEGFEQRLMEALRTRKKDLLKKINQKKILETTDEKEIEKLVKSI
ncbi:F0F1 ATP synthase subunit alpha [Candidatus Roizmanbacteria bacterium RIFCSPLOWO2_12_FULL_40_12]|uniref:ATP synthase subunit alpha n=1 Tax=Candidatus Roizmanbacteria bacterium RIFCSPLOWO2_01_FULL_40_42 TaxID=1802066 RepID=A0A1F7J6Q9_9BACT|nr:MAG: F0F1 ATP synthase subunit alpha [Candidatus Roizmanbacteria bacterium RIFCSPHIGHO2_01_FULL_40_98]OGK29173.1 MAG: F0F1 ATP synthase subunit alpha [Candidatus Roizmanbacteria bacterium RIFCSPHIGHO2_02_FULL_40_53]OGK30700.1 MAG: F0F1 ATP synthase subunit alpha [Candidatus Roizmanbacteria bacterium RIFCSPHIGHO2_12_41_18]OGK37209.1 MAG: F0F1 ATP synthase subunit alpha [Candidatus Roizmanbacteria bacterium RIFCSPHIGHO2_12_FULL_40_130]OGK51283.1 MAG: F0F1 ATP synthase subunit alpha [Candidatus